MTSKWRHLDAVPDGKTQAANKPRDFSLKSTVDGVECPIGLMHGRNN